MPVADTARAALRRARRAERRARRRYAGSITGVRTTDPVVSFTYDDGPHPEHTPAVLDALAATGARATFFVLAGQAERHPEIVARALADGHEIGLHGGEHRNLRGATLQEARAIVSEGKRRVEAVSGAPIRWFRPPYGEQTPLSYALARAAGMDVVVWSANARDCYAGGIDEYTDNVARRLRPGGIALFHDGFGGPDARADDRERGAPVFDRGALATRCAADAATQGWSVVTVRALLAERTPARQLWYRA